MDIAYAVRQMDREIAHAKAQLAEKQAAREQLFKALSSQQQALIEDAKTSLHAPPAAPPPRK